MLLLKTLLYWIYQAGCYFNEGCRRLAPIGDLFIRYWVAKIFFMSALTKLHTWQSTLYLFTYEYKVPLLSPYWAALIGTASELVLPVLLLLGIGGRFTTFSLFIFNIVAVISYPFLFTATGAVGLQEHIYWGMLLLMLLLHGNGPISVDFLVRYWWHQQKSSSL
jgi:putative oxidoreductase